MTHQEGSVSAVPARSADTRSQSSLIAHTYLAGAYKLQISAGEGGAALASHLCRGRCSRRGALHTPHVPVRNLPGCAGCKWPDVSPNVFKQWNWPDWAGFGRLVRPWPTTLLNGRAEKIIAWPPPPNRSLDSSITADQLLARKSQIAVVLRSKHRS